MLPWSGDIAAEDSGLADAAAACGGESFTAGAKVLLANRIGVPIAGLKPGDKVLATSTRTGKTRAEPVTAVLVHHDTNRYDLTIKTAHGTGVIDTTSTHLFWDPATRQWAKAATLGHGTRLRTPSGATAMVVGGHAPRNRDGRMWDLTVTNDHDFYIQVASSAVLVHNCPVFAGRDPAFRANLENEIGPPPHGEYDAHHIFPVEFGRDFAQAGIDVNNPGYGTWVARSLHQGMSSEYSNDWAAFLQGSPTSTQMFDFGRMLAQKYGFDVHF